jgi:beta-lactamase class D
VTDLVKEETHVYNPQRAAEPFIPASTYKIPHSLIALETGVDHFWLDGALRITALQQIEFLKKFYLNQLPVSERSSLIVKDMLINEANSKYILRAKSGLGSSRTPAIGWWVGWVETDNDTYFFALNLDVAKDQDAPKRMIVARQCLASLGILPAAN